MKTGSSTVDSTPLSHSLELVVEREAQANEVDEKLVVRAGVHERVGVLVLVANALDVDLARQKKRQNRRANQRACEVRHVLRIT